VCLELEDNPPIPLICSTQSDASASLASARLQICRCREGKWHTENNSKQIMQIGRGDARGFETAYFALRCAAAEIQILMRVELYALERERERSCRESRLKLARDLFVRERRPVQKDFGAKRATAKKFARSEKAFSFQTLSLIIEAMNLGADGEDKLGAVCVRVLTDCECIVCLVMLLACALP
jgi:hypothetical protein